MSDFVQVAARISGVGMHVPEKVVPNSHFESYLDTTDQWISERTGISERRWAEPGTGASEIAEPACRKAIEAAGLSVDDIDAIVCATVTSDYVFPSTGCLLQKRLGIKKGFAYDVNAVCSGFVYALVDANGLIATGQAKNVLVVGVDVYSSIIDHKDRGTCILFGDGAGAVVLSAVAPEANTPTERYSSGSRESERGIYASELRSDGAHSDILCVKQGSAVPLTKEFIDNRGQFLHMAGREVFKLAVRSLADISVSVLEKAGFSESEVDFFVSHQANIRILHSMAKSLSVSEEKVLANVHKYGNTSAATIPIVLAEFTEDGTIKKGDLLLLNAFGGGVTWGAVLLRY